MKPSKAELLKNLNAAADLLVSRRTNDDPYGDDWTAVAAIEDAAAFIVESEPEGPSRDALAHEFIWGRADITPPLEG